MWRAIRWAVIPGLVVVPLVLVAPVLASAQDATARPDVYRVTLRKMEFSTNNGTTWVTLKEEDLTFNMSDVAAGASVGNYISGAGLPVGTYNRMRVTVSCTMALKGEITNAGITYRTTAAGGTCQTPPGPCGAAGEANFTAPAAICPTGNFVATSPAGAISFTVEENKSVTVFVDINTDQALALFGGGLFPGSPTVNMTIQ